MIHRHHATLIMRIFFIFSFAILLTQCIVHYTPSQIPAQAWRPGDLCKIKSKLYIVKDGGDYTLECPKNVGSSLVSSGAVVGVLNPGDLLRIVSCSETFASSIGGTYLDALVVKGDLAGKIVTGLDSISMKYINNNSGVPFSTPDPIWFERINP